MTRLLARSVFPKPSDQVIRITNMKQLENSKKNLALAIQRVGHEIDVIPAEPFGYYWVEGGTSEELAKLNGQDACRVYYLVRIWKDQETDLHANVACGCISSYVCYHIQAAAREHIIRKASKVTAAFIPAPLVFG